jgi:hypothetical protein
LSYLAWRERRRPGFPFTHKTQFPIHNPAAGVFLVKNYYSSSVLLPAKKMLGYFLRRQAGKAAEERYISLVNVLRSLLRLNYFEIRAIFHMFHFFMPLPVAGVLDPSSC